MPPLPIQVECRKRQGWKGLEHFIPGESCVHVSTPPLDIVCCNCKASGHMQRDCSQPRPPFCVCVVTRRFTSLVSALRPPLQDSRAARAKVPPKLKGKARGKAVSRMCFLVHSLRPLNRCENAMVVRWEEDCLQALFCVILPV